MPSPVGHTLLGLAVANIPLKQKLYQSVFWLGFVVFTANAPDLDFLPGWFLGDINRFHHGISHSVGMGLIFATLSALISKLFTEKAMLVFWVALVVFISHLLGDYLGVDVVEPYGAPFLWPLSNEYYLAPYQIFHPVEHGSVGEASRTVFDKIFSFENIIAASVEILIVAPLWLITFFSSRR